MTTCSFEDAALDIPDEYRAALIVSAPTKAGESFASNLIVTRDRLRPNEQFSEYLDRQVVELGKSLKKFKLHGRRSIDVGGVEGHEISCGCLGSQGPIEQRLTFVPREGTVISFTSTAAKSRASDVLPIFELIVRSTRIG
jgi:hypothetical protein